MALKAQKALELQVNEMIHKNISILTYFHPPHKDFHEIFRKDMFIKNNKSAFIHVVYYLLHTLNPNVIKTKIRSWPVLDVNYERQFRNEVFKYLNELNDIYKNAKLPSVMASQLVSPGGFRFAKYILKLSILVLQEVQMNNSRLGNKILMRPNLSRHGVTAEKQILHIDKLTSHINHETQLKRLEFHKKYLELKDEADKILKELEEVQTAIKEMQDKIDGFNVNVIKNSQQYEERIEFINADLLKVTLHCDVLHQIKEKLDYIRKSNLTLENTSISCEELDLISLFEKFHLEMESYCLEMESLTEPELDHYIEKFVKCNKEFVLLKNNLDNIRKKWINLSANIQKTYNAFKHTKPIIQNKDIFALQLSSSDSTILAVPLDVSESI